MKIKETMKSVNFNHKTILITGGAGFIGSNIALYLNIHYPNAHIVIFDCFRDDTCLDNGNLKSLGHYKNLIGFEGDIICGDLNNTADLVKLNTYCFDYIFHLAAISDTRVDDQNLLMRTNINSFYPLLSLAVKNNATIIYASSAATYGDTPSPQQVGKEHPENPYGYSKFMMDSIAKRYAEKTGVTAIGLRYFNVYGKGEYFKDKTASMILQLGMQILASRKVKLFKNSDKIFRDFVYIKDVVQASINAAASSKSAVYNVGSGIARSFIDIVHILENNLHSDVKIKFIENPYAHYQNHTCADISATKKDLAYSVNYTLERGITDYLGEIQRLFYLFSK